jgi:predicted lipoprotein with Yx(FWY)xxD motif
MRNRWLAPAGLAAAALVVAACGSSSSSGGSGGSGSSPAAHGSSSTLDAGTVNGAKLLVNGKGLTVYTFALDTLNKSNCNGSCLQYWPPVPGPATAMAGVKGTLGVITRSNGAKQATWNGHPLYTYIADTAGTAKGNGLNLSGGVWHDIVLSGTSAVAPSPSSGGGGYGY